ncbi:Helicase associated domain protein [Actinocatenispora sera]|uniref:Helicase associated domain protein n=1 Tax=Actinocatenispora sera TaxID=390989 RepID=UPI00340BF5AD
MAAPARTGQAPNRPLPASRPGPARTTAAPRPLPASFATALAALAAYAAAHGHCYPTRDTLMPDGRNLATWVSNVRYAYHRGTLAADRAAALAAVPGWVWRSKRPRRRLDTGLSRWAVGYPALVAWMRARGTIPPVGAVDAAGYRVGRFARNCRQHRDRLTIEQRAALVALPGWRWDVSAARRKDRTDRLEALRAFVASHHHLPQLDAADPAERVLAGWARRSHIGIAGELAAIRRTAVPDTWLRRYRLAAAGDTSKSTVEWMSRQRAALRAGTMPEPHRALFGRIRGRQEQRWYQRVEQLRGLLAAGRHPDESAQGWLTRQHRRAANGTLTAEQAAVLAALAGEVAAFRAAHPRRRGAVDCQRPGCTARIQPPARGRAPRYCGPACAAAARGRPAATSPAARSAAALFRLVPALERVAAGQLSGLPALTRRVQRATDSLAGTHPGPPATARRRLRRRWRSRTTGSLRVGQG